MRFYKLTPSMSKFLRDSLNLTDWKLWSYLVTIAPFGNEYYQLPDTLTILTECNISKSSFYRSMAKLQDLGLFDFQDQGFLARNLDGKAVPQMGNQSHGWESSPTDGKVDGENQSHGWEEIPTDGKMESHGWEKIPTDGKISPTDGNFTLYKDIKTLSDQESENFSFPNSISEHPLEQDQPASPDHDRELLDFIIHEVGKGANNPRAYALSILRDDREYWEQRFAESKQPTIAGEIHAEPFADQHRAIPAIEPVNDRAATLARAASLIELAKHPNMAIFARKRFDQLVQDEGISPEELRAFLGEKQGISANVVEVAHPCEVPRLSGTNYDQEYADRCKASQWQYFTDLEF